MAEVNCQMVRSVGEATARYGGEKERRDTGDGEALRTGWIRWRGRLGAGEPMWTCDECIRSGGTVVAEELG